MPPRRLILMRHATAAAGSVRDFDRSLTRRGIDESRQVGERLRDCGQVPDRVLLSSARRCRETWAELAQGLGAEQVAAIAIECDDRLYNASTGRLLDAIHDADDARCLLVLAHNPGISILALELGRANADDEALLRDGFAPATIAVFDVLGDWPELSADATRLVRFERAHRSGTA